MKVMTVDGRSAVVEQGGVSCTARIDFVPGVAPGDYVLVHAGVAIEQLDEADALETLALIREMTDEVR